MERLRRCIWASSSPMCASACLISDLSWAVSRSSLAIDRPTEKIFASSDLISPSARAVSAVASAIRFRMALRSPFA